MKLLFCLLPLVCVSADVVTSKLLLTPLKTVEAAYSAYAIRRHPAFLAVLGNSKLFYQGRDEKECIQTITQCEKKKSKNFEQCVGTDMNKGQIAKLFKKLDVTEMRNENKTYTEKYTEFGNLHEADWVLYNGEKNMTCKAQIQLDVRGDQYPRIKLIKLICDRCQM